MFNKIMLRTKWRYNKQQIGQGFTGCSQNVSFSSCYTCQDKSDIKGIPVASHRPCHLIFGANTDVGKTIVSTGLVQEALRSNAHKRDHMTHYIKPLQCGGGDAVFVRDHALRIMKSQNHKPGGMIHPSVESRLQTDTLFHWNTPASPHLASRIEQYPCSDEEVISALEQTIRSHVYSRHDCNTFIETAGGVLSPSASSPRNTQLHHAAINRGPSFSSLLMGGKMLLASHNMYINSV